MATTSNPAPPIWHDDGTVTLWHDDSPGVRLRVRPCLWRRLGYPVDQVQAGQHVSSNTSFIAGSPVLLQADQLRGQMEQAFAVMRMDGSWWRILAQHLGEEVALRLSTP